MLYFFILELFFIFYKPKISFELTTVSVFWPAIILFTYDSISSTCSCSSCNASSYSCCVCSTESNKLLVDIYEGVAIHVNKGFPYYIL